MSQPSDPDAVVTEELARSGAAEFLTLDAGFVNQAAKNAPSVKVNLL